ncbi:MAG TPA: VTT domain-containing protein [Desulfomonilia bacterium]|nr:VTT domain-containing protein [Desulfomonilia bacterium]
MSFKIDREVIADVSRIILLVAFFSAAALVMKRPEVRKLLFDVNTMRAALQGGSQSSGRIYSTIIFTFTAGGLIALGVPRIWSSAAAGVIYGALMGTALSLMASLIGASALYAAGRFVLSSVVERRTGDTLKVWKERFRQNAFWWVLYGRFFPFSNSTAMSLLCGGCRVPFIPYVTGSFIGFVPLAVVFAAYGSGGVKGNMHQIALATVLLVLAVFSRRILRRWFPPDTKIP